MLECKIYNVSSIQIAPQPFIMKQIPGILLIVRLVFFAGLTLVGYQQHNILVATIFGILLGYTMHEMSKFAHIRKKASRDNYAC